MARAERSVRRADVVLLFFDPQQRVSKVDKQLADYVLEQHKPAIFVVNKWDLMANSMPTGEMATYLRATFPSLDYVPIAFITANQGRNIQAVVNLAQNLHKQSSQRLTTGDLNRVLRAALQASAPPMRMNRRPKVYYATQVSTNPPTIVLFTNGPELFDNTYQRYLLKTIRDQLAFNDVPIKLYLRRRNREDQSPIDTDSATPAAAGSKRGKTPKPDRDLTDLPFRTSLEDHEVERHGGNTELWKDL